MARYIDVDLLIKNIAGIEDLRTLSTKTVGKVIKNTPTADVEEVVRCKDCKYNTELDGYEKRTYIEGCVACKYIHPNGEKLVMCADDFCSYGERKENEIHKQSDTKKGYGNSFEIYD